MAAGSKLKEETEKKKKVKVSRPEKFLSSIFGRRPGKVSFSQKLFSRTPHQNLPAEKTPKPQKETKTNEHIAATVHVRDDMAEYANEREIKRVGTQGVVQLFNAVTKYRKESLEKQQHAEPGFKFKK